MTYETRSLSDAEIEGVAGGNLFLAGVVVGAGAGIAAAGAGLIIGHTINEAIDNRDKIMEESRAVYEKVVGLLPSSKDDEETVVPGT